MDRKYYLDLAASELKMPIGTHLVLHEHADHAIIPDDGRRLGGVIEEAARRFHCPMALPLMVRSSMNSKSSASSVDTAANSAAVGSAG